MACLDIDVKGTGTLDDLDLLGGMEGGAAELREEDARRVRRTTVSRQPEERRVRHFELAGHGEVAALEEKGEDVDGQLGEGLLVDHLRGLLRARFNLAELRRRDGRQFAEQTGRAEAATGDGQGLDGRLLTLLRRRDQLLQNRLLSLGGRTCSSCVRRLSTSIRAASSRRSLAARKLT